MRFGHSRTKQVIVNDTLICSHKLFCSKHHDTNVSILSTSFSLYISPNAVCSFRLDLSALKTCNGSLLMVKEVTYWGTAGGRRWRWWWRDTRNISEWRFAVGFQRVFHHPVVCSLITAAIIFYYAISAYT